MSYFDSRGGEKCKRGCFLFTLWAGAQKGRYDPLLRVYQNLTCEKELLRLVGELAQRA